MPVVRCDRYPELRVTFEDGTVVQFQGGEANVDKTHVAALLNLAAPDDAGIIEVKKTKKD